MKEIRKQKKKKKKKDLSRSDRSRPSRPIIRAAQSGEFYLPPAAASPQRPRFSFYYFLFFRTYLHSNTNMIYNTFFGSVCF
jgi:hypothetical protein